MEGWGRPEPAHPGCISSGRLGFLWWSSQAQGPIPGPMQLSSQPSGCFFLWISAKGSPLCRGLIQAPHHGFPSPASLTGLLWTGGAAWVFTVCSRTRPSSSSLLGTPIILPPISQLGRTRHRQLCVREPALIVKLPGIWQTSGSTWSWLEIKHFNKG